MCERRESRERRASFTHVFHVFHVFHTFMCILWPNGLLSGISAETTCGHMKTLVIHFCAVVATKAFAKQCPASASQEDYTLVFPQCRRRYLPNNVSCKRKPRSAYSKNSEPPPAKLNDRKQHVAPLPPCQPPHPQKFNVVLVKVIQEQQFILVCIYLT